MLNDKEDILRFLMSNPNAKLGDIFNQFQVYGEEFTKNLSNYLIELKSGGYIDFPGSRPSAYCWIKITTRGKEYLEERDRQIEQERFNRDQLLKRLEAAERTAAAVEADVKESRRIADSAVKHAAAAEAVSMESDEKATNANRIAFAAVAVSIVTLLCDHWDKLMALWQTLTKLLKALL